MTAEIVTLPAPIATGFCHGCGMSLAGRRADARACRSSRCRMRIKRAGDAVVTWSEWHAHAYGLEPRDFWRTNPDLFAVLSAYYGPFDLDAAATPEDALAPRFLTPVDNALDPSTSWVEAGGGFGCRIFNNPPFSRKGGRGDGLLAWVRAAIRARDAGAAIVVQVMPSMSATEWAKLMKAEAVAILDPDKRINYIDPDTGLLCKGARGESLVGVFRHGQRGPALRRGLAVPT